MLKSLLIQNYALIRHTEISPASSLNIITGETGAGKSIMLGALGLLKGERAESKVLFDESAKCVIEAIFEIADYQLKELFQEHEIEYESTAILRRELAPNGKSRAFINDTPVRLEALREIGNRLMDVHSQHDTLQLGSGAFQLYVIDSFAQNQTLLNQTAEKYKTFRKIELAYKNLLEEYNESKKEYDYHAFLLDELIKADLDKLDATALEQELERIENAENIKENLNNALEYLSKSEYAVIGALKSVGNILGQIAGYSTEFAQLRERVDSCRIELADVIDEIESQEADLSTDYERMTQIKDRLDEVYRLEQKHRVKEVSELIAIRDELEQKVAKVNNFDDDLAALLEEKQKTYTALLEDAQKLSASRQAVIPSLAQQLNGLLASLGMPNARIIIEQNTIEASATGIDEVKILFSANKGIAPQDLKSVASGGEFSRLMLAVKYILAGKTALPTIIFDEIDTGISGEIAMKVGNMMTEMSQRHQVIVISHLPQIAALGQKHYYVYKDDSAEKTVSKIRELNHQERLTEIAQMIGGANASATAYESAKELMNKA